jgi:hypothetical protein
VIPALIVTSVNDAAAAQFDRATDIAAANAADAQKYRNLNRIQATFTKTC